MFYQVRYGSNAVSKASFDEISNYQYEVPTNLKNLMQSLHSMAHFSYFLSIKEKLKMNLINKLFYEKHVPNAFATNGIFAKSFIIFYESTIMN